jgi:short-subunit dehydrogenase
MVNNAGITTRSLARDASFAMYEKTTIVDYLSHVRIAQSILPHMIEQRTGHFVNITSACGKFGVPLRTAYCGAKHAMLGYFNALRLEEAPSGICVTNICPGFVRTNISINAIGSDGKPTGNMDPVIETGMDPDRCAELILVATYNKLDESWIGGKRELLALYVNQYFPTLLYPVMNRQVKTLVAQSSSSSISRSRSPKGKM